MRLLFNFREKLAFETDLLGVRAFVIVLGHLVLFHFNITFVLASEAAQCNLLHMIVAKILINQRLLGTPLHQYGGRLE